MVAFMVNSLVVFPLLTVVVAVSTYFFYPKKFDVVSNLCIVSCGGSILIGVVYTVFFSFLGAVVTLVSY